MKEIDPLKANYSDMVDFVMNMLEVGNRDPGREDPAIRTAYYAALTFISVARSGNSQYFRSSRTATFLQSGES